MPADYPNLELLAREVAEELRLVRAARKQFERLVGEARGGLDQAVEETNGRLMALVDAREAEIQRLESVRCLVSQLRDDLTKARDGTQVETDSLLAELRAERELESTLRDDAYQEQLHLLQARLDAEIGESRAAWSRRGEEFEKRLTAVEPVAGQIDGLQARVEAVELHLADAATETAARLDRLEQDGAAQTARWEGVRGPLAELHARTSGLEAAQIEAQDSLTGLYEQGSSLADRLARLAANEQAHREADRDEVRAMLQQTTALRTELSQVSAALDHTGEQVRLLAHTTALESQRLCELAGALDRLTQAHGHDLARLSDGLAAIQGTSGPWARAEHLQALEVRLVADLEAVREHLDRLAAQQRRALTGTSAEWRKVLSPVGEAQPRSDTRPAEGAGELSAGRSATAAEVPPEAGPGGARLGVAGVRHRRAIAASDPRGNDPAPRSTPAGADDPDRVEL
ncbi:MAG: hypothetical protein HUU35_08100 [Armatimonadetes bacterium]|nr:hypothetical protein [Armatimonadota bacterium]